MNIKRFKLVDAINTPTVSKTKQKTQKQSQKKSQKQLFPINEDIEVKEVNLVFKDNEMDVFSQLNIPIKNEEKILSNALFGDPSKYIYDVSKYIYMINPKNEERHHC